MSETPLWMAAASMAARAHGGQTRRDGRTPYVAHCFRVAMVVRDVFECDDEVCLAIALLHDVIEDTPADYDNVRRRCGAEVAEGVAALSKDMRRPEPEREPAYDEQIAAASWRAKLVKLADTVDNLIDTEGPTDKARARLGRALAIAEADTSGRLGPAIAASRGVLERFSG